MTPKEDITVMQNLHYILEITLGLQHMYMIEITSIKNNRTT